MPPQGIPLFWGERGDDFFEAEAAILLTVLPGNYTAILRGADGGTGSGLVEVYKLAP